MKDYIEASALILFKEKTFLEIKMERQKVGEDIQSEYIQSLDRAIEMWRMYMGLKLTMQRDGKG